MDGKTNKRNFRIILLVALILLSALIAFWFLTTRVAAPKTTPREPKSYAPTSYTPDQLIINYKEGLSPEELQSQINDQALGQRVKNIISDPQKKLDELNQLDLQAGVISKEKVFSSNDLKLKRYYLLKLKPGSNLPDIERLYLEYNFIEGTEPNFLLKAQSVPNDTFYSQMWDFQKIQMEPAWDITKGSNAVIVAVLDTGINSNHEDFLGRTISGYDFINSDNSPLDDNGHGSHTSGTIGAVTNNSKGVAGMNWNVSLMSLKILDQAGNGNSLNTMRAIQTATDNGAKVINMSLSDDTGTAGCSTFFQNMVDYAVSKGVFLVAAAGNGNTSADNGLPGSCNGVTAVGATGPNDERASYSNYGNVVVISAPGGNVQAGSNCTPSTCISSTWLNNSYAAIKGTSMAAPHVAGAAALLLANNPALTPAQIRNCLISNADPVFTSQPMGPRLNVFKALQNCRPGTSPTPSASPSRSPSPSPSTSLRPSPTPTPSARVTTSTPAPSTSAGGGGQVGQPANNNNGIPGAEDIPPGYYADTPEEETLIPYVCHLAPPGAGGKQLQINYLICTAR